MPENFQKNTRKPCFQPRIPEKLQNIEITRYRKIKICFGIIFGVPVFFYSQDSCSFGYLFVQESSCLSCLGLGNASGSPVLVLVLRVSVVLVLVFASPVLVSLLLVPVLVFASVSSVMVLALLLRFCETMTPRPQCHDQSRSLL